MMFSESRNERRRRIGARRSRQHRMDRRQLRRNRRQLCRNRRWRRRDRRYRRECDHMLNSVLNGDWSNSVPGRKIPEGTYSSLHSEWSLAWGPVWKKNAHLANISFCIVSAKKIIYIIIIKNPPKFT